MKRAIASPLFVLVLSVAGAAPSGESGPRLLLLCDMEGVTGVTRPEDVNLGSPSYPAARESLTEDVNAAIRGLLKGGASEVVLTDGHGSGNPEPDYFLKRLPKGARFDIRALPYDPYIESMDATSRRDQGWPHELVGGTTKRLLQTELLAGREQFNRLATTLSRVSGRLAV